MNQQTGEANVEKNFFVCPVTGFQFCIRPRFLAGAVLMIIWLNLFAWFWHGSVLAASYQASASLWRGPADMSPLFLNGGLALMGFVAAYIFAKGYEGTGWKEGIRFGIVVTGLLLGMGMITYATQPIPFFIILMWVIGDLISYCVGGIMLSFIMPKCSKA